MNFYYEVMAGCPLQDALRKPPYIKNEAFFVERLLSCKLVFYEVVISFSPEER
jgi:hypothetical protein